MASLLVGTDATFAADEGLFDLFIEASATTYSVTSNTGAIVFNIDVDGGMEWHAQANHTLPTVRGMAYTLCFNARTDISEKAIKVNFDTNTGDALVTPAIPAYSSGTVEGTYTAALTDVNQLFTVPFTGVFTTDVTRLSFTLAGVAGNVTLDNVGVYAGTVVCPAL